MMTTMTPAKIQNLFVYGTLRTDMNDTAMLDFMSRGESRGRAMTFAKMFDLGNFPACVLDDDTRIIGQVVSFENQSPKKWRRILKAIDKYEAAPDLFERKPITAILEDGTAVPAWMYFFVTGNKLSKEPTVPRGDWKEYLKQLNAL